MKKVITILSLILWIASEGTKHQTFTGYAQYSSASACALAKEQANSWLNSMERTSWGYEVTTSRSDCSCSKSDDKVTPTPYGYNQVEKLPYVCAVDATVTMRRK
ncbi:MAG: hypothetical protein QXL17_02860 [Candidatus Thermoplasmatota archaeon]